MEEERDQENATRKCIMHVEYDVYKSPVISILNKESKNLSVIGESGINM